VTDVELNYDLHVLGLEHRLMATLEDRRKTAVAATCQHERSAVSRDGWRWIVQVWANESLGPRIGV